MSLVIATKRPIVLSVLIFLILRTEAFFLNSSPSFKTLSKKRTRVRDAILAVLIGTLTASLVLLESSGQNFPSISKYFSQYSVDKAYGHNIVNVILVDFRGLDTMGEITVLAVAALGVFALLKLRTSKEE